MCQDTNCVSDNERMKMYDKEYSDLFRIQLSNTEKCDQLVLQVSTASLGFSLAFLKGVVPLSGAHLIVLLYISWLLFVVAIICTASSFIFSQKAIKEQFSIIKSRYRDETKESQIQSNKANKITEILNFLSIIFLVCELSISCIFVALNIKIMNKKPLIKTASDAALVPQRAISQTKSNNTTQKNTTPTKEVASKEKTTSTNVPASPKI
jgi:hypothetical protein